MKKSKVKEAIIKAIRDNFEVINEDFVTEESFGFIEMSINNEEFEDHEAFNTKLAEILNKIFPEREKLIFVDNCDTVEDILHNNFVF